MRLISSCLMDSLMKLAIHILSLASLMIPGKCKLQCLLTELTLEENYCSVEAQEIVQFVHPTTHAQFKQCCAGDPETLKRIQKTAAGCDVTKCLVPSKGGDNMCGVFDERYVNGTRIHYKEMLRDACTQTNGTSGSVAYCCPKDSIHSASFSTFGAEQNEFPHQVRLVLNRNQCGATIYNERFIITAAHCLIDEDTLKMKDIGDMKAILGTNIGRMEGDQYVYKVKRAIPHENFTQMVNSEHPNEDLTLNDIAVIELDRDIEFSKRVQKLAIAPKSFNPFMYADHAVVVGWGTTVSLTLSGHLQNANLVFRSDKTCFDKSKKAAHPEYSGHEKELLCMGGITDGKFSRTAGNGDSGGPAICRGSDGKAVLCGVVSFGGDDENCVQNKNEESCLPSVFADVSHYHDWIEAKAGQQGLDNFHQPYLFGEPVPTTSRFHHHQVHITSQTGKSCGGTLIAKDIIITAAHCVMKTDGSGETLSGLVAHYGLKDITKEGGEAFEITKVVIGKNFPKRVDPVDIEGQGNYVTHVDKYYRADISIVKLDRGVAIIGREERLPVLPHAKDIFKIGREIAFPTNTTFGGELRSREFKILDSAVCQKRLNDTSRIGLNKIQVNKKHLCGVETYSGGSLCDRELGGGLICRKNGREVLCGVQIFRLCDSSLPNAFINVAVYAAWIRDGIKKLKLIDKASLEKSSIEGMVFE